MTSRTRDKMTHRGEDHICPCCMHAEKCLLSHDFQKHDCSRCGFCWFEEADDRGRHLTYHGLVRGGYQPDYANCTLKHYEVIEWDGLAIEVEELIR